MGKGNRVPLYQCIVAGVRELFPKEDPKDYTGFKPAPDVDSSSPWKKGKLNKPIVFIYFM